jgi:hypothetical protein
LGDFSQFSVIFHNFRRFFTIFGDFSKFLATFHDFRRFLPIFGYFSQFSAKKLVCFSKINVTIKILPKQQALEQKAQICFANFFGENIYKIVTSVPGQGDQISFCRKTFSTAPR